MTILLLCGATIVASLEQRPPCTGSAHPGGQDEQSVFRVKRERERVSAKPTERQGEEAA